MRNEGGYEVMKKVIEKLGLGLKERIAAPGEGDEQRLTARLETADINTFKWVKGKTKRFPCCLSSLVIRCFTFVS
jgi:glutamine synthetase